VLFKILNTRLRTVISKSKKYQSTTVVQEFNNTFKPYESQESKGSGTRTIIHGQKTLQHVPSVK
jgi:hypothetical protein